MGSSFREDVTRWITERYGCGPERLWLRFPDYAVFRHSDDRKWFCIVMDVPRSALGLKGEGRVDILNVKPGDPLLCSMLRQREGFFRGWHFSSGNWVSVLLDGTVGFGEICSLIDMSYEATASAAKKRRLRSPKDWIVPANPKYYDIVRAFNERDEIEWKQGAGIRTGDTVFVYAAAPVSAILFKCIVTETDIPYDYKSGELTITALMRIKLLRRYDPGDFTFARLKDYGIFAVRGPRGVPPRLAEDLEL
ncbi:MAG: MmcQ/YjbR family DNA-binding protein [Clostridia bacterium]|nr:MmcQ/YjbR family DNA-binding protein [Clostridia bacterium]